MNRLEQLAEELRAGLEGVTPGPWLNDTEMCVGVKFAAGGQATICTTSWTDGKRNAAHIARCSPENIALLLDALATQAARIEELKTDIQISCANIDTEINRANEAEARIEELTRERDEAKFASNEWKQTHGRVVQGFAEVCDEVGVAFDAPEAVAHSINVKIRNALHDARAAEARAEAAEEHVRVLRGAISWIEPPFVDENTPADEMRTRIAFCIADASRAALNQGGK